MGMTNTTPPEAELRQVLITLELQSRCSRFLPACKLCPDLLVDSCRSAAKKVAGSDLRAGLALALQ